jgi:hypothetical protein
MNESSILPSVWEVPQIFRDRLGAKPGRQRAMFHDGHLLLVLHEPPQPEEKEREGRFFWRQPDGTWSSSGLGSGPNALKRHLDEYAEVADQYQKLEDQAASADDYFKVIEGLAPLRRAASNLHIVLQEARKLVPEDRGIIDQRDQSYQVERSLQLQYDTAKNGLEFAIAKRAEEQARSSRYMAAAAHKLNLLVAFFFPLATLTAVFGMNFRSGLEGKLAPWSFVSVLCLGLVSGMILTRFVTKRPDVSSSSQSAK